MDNRKGSERTVSLESRQAQSAIESLRARPSSAATRAAAHGTVNGT